VTADMNVIVEGHFDEMRNRLIVEEFILPEYKYEKSSRRDY
jgi:hypothetical protein